MLYLWDVGDQVGETMRSPPPLTIPERASSELPPICLQSGNHHHHGLTEAFAFLNLFGVLGAHTQRF